jgi:signal transduction histidine kinase
MPVNQRAASLVTAVRPAQTTNSVVRLDGHVAFVARTCWAATAILVLAFVGLSIPAGLVYYGTVCTGVQCGPRLSSAGILALQEMGLSPDGYAAYLVALDTLLAVTCAGVGALLVWRLPREPLALLSAVMLLMFGGVTFSASSQALAAQPTWQWPAAGAGYVGAVSFLAFLYVFPDGRFVPNWARWALLAWAVAELPVHLFAPLLRGTVVDPESFPFYTWLLLGFLGSGLGALVYRYRRVATRAQRQQTKWVVLGTGLAMAGFLGLIVLGVALGPAARERPPGSLVAQTGFRVVILLIPLSIAAAALRFRLWDVDPLINRTLVYGVLTVSVVGLYVGLVSYLGLVFRSQGNPLISLAATGLVAVLFQPLREQLQRLVNRVLYGERDDPYVVLSRLGRRLEGTLAPDTVLPTIVRTVAEALRLPSAELALAGEGPEMLVAYGSSVAGMLALPLVYQGEVVGELRLSPRAADEPFSPADRRLLDDLARQAGVAAHAVRLTADLRRSRERLVTALEEERRRLRRDLHDGLGPRLASLGLQLAALRNTQAHAPDVQTKLQSLKEQTQEAVEDIRRLVYGLRPPALDELGLTAAIVEQAQRYAQQSPGLHVVVDAPDDLPALPAAMEVAAYRIANEALTNVARHAHAAACTVRLGVVKQHGHTVLEVEVTDDGTGFAPGARAGTGLLSMRERAEELSGDCTIQQLATGGTRVLARLPFAEC